jgi:hypothetical protein
MTYLTTLHHLVKGKLIGGMMVSVLAWYVFQKMEECGGRYMFLCKK